jgi:urease accessory protein
MRRATAVLSAGNWPADAAVGEVTLAFDQRHRRRLRMTDDAGEPFLLDLAKAVVLVDGDGLALDGDGYIRVRAAAEPVADVRAGTAAETARLAWHIGNRHTPVQVLDDGTLRIRDDHVLVAMLEGLGAVVSRRLAPFAPEPGAYAGDGHGHDH